MKQPKLKTDRLLLRPFDLNDALRVKELAGDIAIAKTTLNIPHPYENGVAEEWIVTHQPKFESGETVTFAMTLRSSELLIGAIGLTFNKKYDRAELGYWVGKEYWNRGYCTEATETVIKHGFISWDLNKIIAIHLARNPSSGKVMEKVGMKKEGLLKQHVKKWDQYEDVISCGILKEEWDPDYDWSMATEQQRI